MSQDNSSNDPARKPPRSAESILSAGIGESTTALARLPPELDLPRLSPEGGAEVDEPVYDCIVYLIFCSEHQRLAVTNVTKCKCTWLPFVALSDGITWQEGSQDGVLALIGRADAEVDAEEAERMTPIYTLRYVHVLRVQLPTPGGTSRVATRLAQYVQLERNTAFLCCQDSDRVNWLPLEHIHHQVDRIWGPELWILARMLFSPMPNIINEFTIENALYYFDQDQTGWEHALLKGAHLSRAQVLDIYGDFVEHTWPSFYMCYDAFRAYFIKHGHPADEPKLKRLYAVFGVNQRTFVDFHEFLIGLVCLEPACPSTLSSRLWFIFRYYSTDQQFLSASDLTAVLTDAHPDWSPGKAATEAEAMLTRRDTNCLSLEEFIEQYQLTGNQELHRLCRSPKSIIAAIAMALSANAEEAARQSQLSSLQTNRTSRGACWACRHQQYEHGMHLVTLSSDGRCAEPRIMQLQPGGSTSEEAQARARYSIEYVFTIGSVPNIFIDLIRDFSDKRASLKVSGLMATESDAPIFLKYLKVLCTDISQLLAHEERLLKINSSTVVIGDLRGNLRDLLALEKMFFQSFPVGAENLVALGNYSGDCGYGVECIVFLFALKLVSPNKVFLLRGSEEVDDETSNALKKECLHKYGSAYGKIIHSIFVAIFAKLPIALVVDETILCAHGGIPSSSASLNELVELPKEMAHLKRDAPMAYEMVTRYPEEEEANKAQQVASEESSDLQRDSSADGSQVAKSTTIAPKASELDLGGTSKSQASDVSLAVTSSPDVLGSCKDELRNFKFTPSTSRKLRPTFLTSLKTTMGRKSIRFKSSTLIRSRLTTESKSEKAKQSTGPSFGRRECTEFLDANELAFLIRAGAACPSGFSATFANRCLNIFSCSNYEKRSNEAAVVLIDGIDHAIRIIRYDTSCTSK